MYSFSKLTFWYIVGCRTYFSVLVHALFPVAGGDKPLLLVANDKGKISTLHVSSMFRNIENSKRRPVLTVSRSVVALSTTARFSFSSC